MSTFHQPPPKRNLPSPPAAAWELLTSRSTPPSRSTREEPPPPNSRRRAPRTFASPLPPWVPVSAHPPPITRSGRFRCLSQDLNKKKKTLPLQSSTDVSGNQSPLRPGGPHTIPLPTNSSEARIKGAHRRIVAQGESRLVSPPVKLSEHGFVVRSFQKRVAPRFMSIPSGSQQSAYYTCCPSNDSPAASSSSSPEISSGAASDLWSLPLRSCLSDTNLQLDCLSSSASSSSPGRARHHRSTPERKLYSPFFHKSREPPQQPPLWSPLPTTPAWQVLMRRMVGRSRRSPGLASSEYLTGPKTDKPQQETEPVLAKEEDSSSAPEEGTDEEDAVFDPLKQFQPNRSQTGPGLLQPELPPTITVQPAPAVKASSLEVLRLMYIDTAAVTIQRIWRGWVGRGKANFHKQKRCARLMAERASIKIQSVWRGIQARWKAYLSQQISLHTKCRQAAVIQLQRAWRRWQMQNELKMEKLIEVLGHTRQVSASLIQRTWRGHKVRKIIEEEWSHWVVKWIWDPRGRKVEVIGDFTDPPWQERIPMEYCPIRRCYVTKLPRKAGHYEFKFCVEDRFVCCGAGTVVEDGSGHYNNVVDVFDVTTQSPFAKCRETISKLLMERPGELAVPMRADNDWSPRTASSSPTTYRMNNNEVARHVLRSNEAPLPMFSPNELFSMDDASTEQHHSQARVAISTPNILPEVSDWGGPLTEMATLKLDSPKAPNFLLKEDLHSTNHIKDDPDPFSSESSAQSGEQQIATVPPNHNTRRKRRRRRKSRTPTNTAKA